MVTKSYSRSIIMDLKLDNNDVYLDARSELAKLSERRRSEVNRREHTSSTFSHLEQLLKKNGPVDSEYKEYLMQILGDLVEESEDDVMLERQNDTSSNDHDPPHRILFSDESEDDVMTERHSDTGSDDHDPQYRIFLSRVKQQGKSYALEVKGENGLNKFMEYEVEHGTNDEHYAAIKRKMKNDIKGEEAGNGEHLRSIQNEYTMETLKSLSSVQESGRKGLQIYRNKKSSSPRSASLGKNDYLSQNLHSRKNCTSQNRLKSDTKCGLDKKLKTKSQRISSDLVKGEKISEVPEDYQYFLDNSEIVTGFMILQLPEGDMIEYEKDYGFEAARSKVEWFESTSSGDLVASMEEEDSCLCLGSASEEKSSPFRQKVMSILRKPYDHEEYKKLWHDIKIQKKISRHIDLRNGREKPYSANKVGKSYLDYFKDLSEKIEAVEDDQHKKLNILRGFFFWLQNLTQEGVFKPWQDAACLAVMPVLDDEEKEVFG